ncbi:hypothetical protein HID58_023909 [Brassica napus]|uniref:Uncharacterized protein n=1 Tax=Brassica napus TaxID=3708 RepID=A0ABQ8D3N4_BRANA|nr:hypothetical protein HID58_023909 [Brassica napus]
MERFSFASPPVCPSPVRYASGIGFGFCFRLRPCSREVRSGDIFALSGLLEEILFSPLLDFSLGARRSWRRSEGLAFLSAVFSKLRRILIPQSRVMSLGYAGGDGGSSLFQHVGDTRTACKVVVYDSSAAVRRLSSLWTSAAFSLYGSSGFEAFYMEFGGEHKPDSRWRKLYMPVVGFLLSVEILIVGDDYKSMRSSGASYSEGDMESPGIRRNKLVCN